MEKKENEKVEEKSEELELELDTGYKLYQASIEKHQELDMIGYRPYEDENDSSKRGSYQWMTYGQFHEYVLAFGNGLQSLGLEEKVCIAIYASNRPEWFVIHMANLSQSFKTTPVYDTLG